MKNMENAGKTHGKKGWKNWEKCRKLMKNYEKWKVHYACIIFHLLEPKKKGWIVGSTEEITNTMIRMGMGWF